MGAVAVCGCGVRFDKFCHHFVGNGAKLREKLPALLSCSNFLVRKQLKIIEIVKVDVKNVKKT